MPGDKYDPDEKFSLWPMTAEEVVKKLAGEDVEIEPDDLEDDDS